MPHRTPADRLTVAIVQAYVPSYRRPLFDLLAAALAEQGIDLQVWHSRPSGATRARSDSVTGTWSRPVRQLRLNLGSKRISYKSIWPRSRHVDLIVTGLASSDIETYLLARDSKRTPVMLWGHGRNYTGKAKNLDSGLERFLVDRAEIIFTYTESGAQHLIDSGVPKAKLRVVRNSTDTSALSAARDSVTTEDINSFKAQYPGLRENNCIFIGALDKSKHLPLLIEAADILASRDKSFTLTIAGTGELSGYIKDCAAKRDYVTTIGRVDIHAMAVASTQSRLLLIPGRVGLVAVDGLTLGLPLITTDHQFHAPEIEYLDRSNSEITAPTAASYADGVARILTDRELHHRMQTAALATSRNLSVEHSAAVFSNAITTYLRRDPGTS